MKHVLLMTAILFLISCAHQESFVDKEIRNMNIERNSIDLEHKELATTQAVLNERKKANENAEFILLASLLENQVDLYDLWKKENINQPRKMLAFKKFIDSLTKIQAERFIKIQDENMTISKEQARLDSKLADLQMRQDNLRQRYERLYRYTLSR